MFTEVKKKRVKTIHYIIIFFLCLRAIGQEKILDINPVYQATPVWCWVSVGEMIFKYYDVCSINQYGNYQCGIIALLGPACDADCRNCQVPAGSASRIQNMLLEYPNTARQVCGSDIPFISSTIIDTEIGAEDVVNEIENDKPIIAGISPSGDFNTEPSHVALIIGYDIKSLEFYLIVNDPFPYEFFGTSTDPYIASGGEFITSGQYRIAYADFKKLNWRKTFINIE